MPIVCIYMEFRCRLQPHQLRQARLRAAARAQLMRWLKPKTKRSHREAPEVVKTQWNTGNKNDIADMLAKCNFDKDLSQTWWTSWLLTLCMYNSIRPSCSVKFQVYFLCLNACGQDKFVNELTVVVSRKQKVKMLINEGWHTEEEMRTELHWNKLLAFINTELEHMTYIYILMSISLAQHSHVQTEQSHSKGPYRWCQVSLPVLGTLALQALCLFTSVQDDMMFDSEVVVGFRGCSQWTPICCSIYINIYICK